MIKEKRSVLIVATMDTKGKEALFLADCFKEAGVPVLTIDAGIMGESPFEATVDREEVARSGGMALERVRKLEQEGEALAVMTKGAAVCARKLYREGKVHGIIGIGGSMGTTLGTGVMRAFPVGFPKIMISTMASRNTRFFVGTKDIMMIHSVCDLSGINRITARVLRNGALAMAGMIKGAGKVPAAGRPAVVLSTLGTTEHCAQALRKSLEKSGKEVIVFHTVGSGGEAMEEFIRDEQVEAVIDLSLHELIDHRFGGDYDAGPLRGSAALTMGLPTIIVPGNVDFLVTGPLKSARQRFPRRRYHIHNAAITTIRTKKEEVAEIARLLVKFCNKAKGPVAVLVPSGGFSVWDRTGGPFYDPKAVKIFTEIMEKKLSPGIPLRVLPYNINDPGFADTVHETLEKLLSASRS